MHPNQPITYRAAFVIPVDQPVITDGCLTIDDDEIVSIGTRTKGVSTSRFGSRTRYIDLGDVAIIPALINAHTHLEFSDLSSPLGHPGIQFTDWIRAVVDYRRQQSETPQTKRAAIARGLDECQASGVVHVGEIATAPLEISDYFADSIDAESSDLSNSMASVETTLFFERIGRQPTQFDIRLHESRSFLKSQVPLRKDIRKGISPHAPYSVHPKLLESLTSICNQLQVPLAMHLAETEAERELLESQSGPFVDLLNGLGAWNIASFTPQATIKDYLSIIARVSRSLVVHGNYLTRDEIAFIGQHRKAISVVYCPRTHHYFQHRDYPLGDFLDQRINVAIGTDSRASNPDLNLFNELQFVQSSFPHLSPERVLGLGTFNGAQALGVESRLGSLSVGKAAKFCVVSSNRFHSKNIDWLLGNEAVCRPGRINPS